MRFEYSYRGSTTVDNSADGTRMSFVPDAQRAPTFFKGNLRTGIEFREAISALHDVVVSDLRFKPKDREDYKAWLERQEQTELLEIMSMAANVKAQADALKGDLADIDARIQRHMGPFYKARQRYFNYLYKRDYNAWFVLDPVITVHPDQMFFECFSQDESTYGRLSANYEEFDNVGEFACGTTNIDYSASLYDEFQKIRTYKTTAFEVDPSGFEVQTTGEESFKEVKIDLPDSWVRGFLQVSSAMTLPAVEFELHPMDVYNLCFFLRRNREKKGPRSLRFQLKPGHPVKIGIEPWNTELVCPRSVYKGSEEHEVRVWGRRRLHILERLIPVAKRFRVSLLGKGMPSFWVADLGSMSFTLGLSGWTANDWSTAGNFDLMAPRAAVDESTKTRVFESLKQTWFATADELCQRLALDRPTVLGALGMWTQAGRVIYDLDKQVYRARELSREPLPMEKLRFANEREASATRLLDGSQVKLSTPRVDHQGQLHLKGEVRDGGRTHDVTLTVDDDERLRRAECDCSFYFRNKLFKGPCEHILAVRMAFSRTRS